MVRHYHGRRGGGRLILGYRHNVVVPTSSDKNIIFPINRETGCFNLSFYDPSMTGGTIQREEVASFLQQLEPTLKPIFNSPVLTFLKCYQKAHPFVFLAIFVAFAIAIVLSIRGGNFQIFFALPAIFFAFFIFLIIVLIINCFAVSNIKSLIAESKDKIRPFIDTQNGELKRKGYFYVVPTHFPYWLELWKEGAGGNMSMQPHYGINVQDMTYASNQPMTYNGAAGYQPMYSGAGGMGAGAGGNNIYYGGSNLQSPASGYNGGIGSGGYQQSPLYSGQQSSMYSANMQA